MGDTESKNKLLRNLTDFIKASPPSNNKEALLKDVTKAINNNNVASIFTKYHGQLQNLSPEEEEEEILINELDQIIIDYLNQPKFPDLSNYYYNSMANVRIKNDKLDEEIAKHKVEIDYRLNDIYIKDNKIDILKLIITGALLSLLTLALNKYVVFDLPVINIISVVISIFLFLIIIRVITNRNKRPLNFREFNYSEGPGELGFWSQLSTLLFENLPIPTIKSRKGSDSNSVVLPAGNP
jgi:hypothetical protein